MKTYTEDDLTPWFPPDMKPVHEGVYEIYDPERPRVRFHSFYGSGGWSFTYENDVSHAFRMRYSHGSWAVGKKWRGLNKQP